MLPRRCLTALFALATSLVAQGPTLLLRGPEPPVVAPGQPAVLELELADGGTAQLVEPLPTTAGLQWTTAAPTRGEASVVRDGRLQSVPTTRWRLEVRAEKVGSYELPPLPVRLGDRELLTRRAHLECATDARGQDLAFVQAIVPQGPLFVGSRVRLVLQFGFAEAALRTQLLQLFPQKLDVPAQLDAPWLAELPGAIALPDDDASAAPALRRDTAKLVLDGRIARAANAGTSERGGVPFATFELEREFVLTSAGLLHVPPALLRFAWATRFQDDFVADRVPLDRQQGLVLGSAIDLRVEPVPSDGRPADYGGAVGRCAIAASARPVELAVGDGLQVELRITGVGNVAWFTPPALDDLQGLRLRGRSERTDGRARVVTYDFAVASENLFAVPAIELPWFDAEARRFERARSEPIPLRVHRGAETARPDAAPRAGPAAATPPPADDLGHARWTIPTVAILLIAIGIRRRRRRERTDRGDATAR